MKNILLTYYTKTNTTKEICEYIMDQLKDTGCDLSLQPMENVKNLENYDLVILGAPIHGMNWATEAKAFADANLALLKDKKVALFYNAYLLNNSRKMWQKPIHKSLNTYISSLNPIAVGEFNGRVDSPFKGIPKLIFGSRPNEPLDRRNWADIDQFVIAVKEHIIQ